jgi:hypothetical protein
MAASGGNVKDYFWEGLKASINDTMEMARMMKADRKDICAPAEILPSSKIQNRMLKIERLSIILLYI